MDRLGKFITAVLLLGVAGFALWDGLGRAKDILRPRTHAVDSGARVEPMYDPPEHLAYEALMEKGRNLHFIDPRAAAENYRAAWHVYSFQKRARCWFDAAIALSRALSESRQWDEALAVAREAKEVARSNANFFRWNGALAYSYAAYAQNGAKRWMDAETTCRAGMGDPGIERSSEYQDYRMLLRQFGDCMIFEKKFAEVEPVLRELHRQYEQLGSKRTAGEEGELVYTDQQLSADLRLQGKLDEAIPPIIEAIDLLARRKPFAADDAKTFESCSKAYTAVLMDQKLPRDEILKRIVPLIKTWDRLRDSSKTRPSASEPAPGEAQSPTSNPRASRRA